MAQRIIAEVTIDAQNLDDAQRQATTYLNRDIKYYIENTQWMTREFPADFVIQASIFLDSYTESGYQRIYTAKAFWGNGDDQKYFDKSWQFSYDEGEQLLYTTSFQSLASFIDYWVFIILAGNLDTWNEFGGNQFYNRAMKIARLGSDSGFSKGWKERLEDAEYLAGDQNLRQLKFQYYEAIDSWDSGNPDRTQDLLDQFMDNLQVSLQRQNSRIFTQDFLKAKHMELAEFAWEVERRDIIDKLIKLDEDHREVYEDVLRDW